jgi:hypothetical protein
MDDYQVRTPTDVIGQHIHLPKWDLTAADGSANGWNYEDGILARQRGRARAGHSPVQQLHRGRCPRRHRRLPESQAAPVLRPLRPGRLARRAHGHATLVRRPAGEHNVDRGLGTIFTHDHLGPSTHQQLGLYATVLAEPAGSTWYHAETGEQLYNPARARTAGRPRGRR